MKNRRTTALCIAMLCSVISFAQTARVNEPDMNKPKLFTSLPEKISFNPASVPALFAQSVGNDVNLTVGELMPFNGKVVSTSSSTETDRNSVVIRSSNFEGAVMTISRILIDGKISYTGRIISMKHADLYELQYRNGQYEFVKKNYYDLVNE